VNISKHDEISQIRREEKTIDRFFVLTSFDTKIETRERAKFTGRILCASSMRALGILVKLRRAYGECLGSQRR
jgi:hypothetical protein